MESIIKGGELNRNLPIKLVTEDKVMFYHGDDFLIRTFCSPNVRKSEIKGYSPKVRVSDTKID